MSTEITTAPSGISTTSFFGALLAGWLIPTVAIGLSPRWLLEKFIPEVGAFYAFFGVVVALSFIYFFRLACMRWPTSSLAARLGFAFGSAVFNYWVVLYSAFMLRALVFGL